MKSREGRVNPRGDMISQHGADKFLGRMGEMWGQFGESTVCRREDGDFAIIRIIIFGGPVEEVNKGFILVDDLGEGGGVFAGGEELIDGFVARV